MVNPLWILKLLVHCQTKCYLTICQTCHLFPCQICQTLDFLIWSGVTQDFMTDWCVAFPRGIFHRSRLYGWLMNRLLRGVITIIFSCSPNVSMTANRSWRRKPLTQTAVWGTENRENLSNCEWNREPHFSAVSVVSCCCLVFVFFSPCSHYYTLPELGPKDLAAAQIKWRVKREAIVFFGKEGQRRFNAAGEGDKIPSLLLFIVIFCTLPKVHLKNYIYV